MISVPSINSICYHSMLESSVNNKKPLVTSSLKVVNFDNCLVKEYFRGLGLGGQPRAVDSLYIDEDGLKYLIEFKDSPLKNIDKLEIHEKILNSILSMNEILGCEQKDLRSRATFILVYNAHKNASFEEIEMGVLAEAKEIEDPLGILKYKMWYFKEIRIMDKKAFEDEYVSTWEQKKS